jgi:U3 small nucleolar ribonucleoprotein component
VGRGESLSFQTTSVILSVNGDEHTRRLERVIRQRITLWNQVENPLV